jgi:hypothetical protein
MTATQMPLRREPCSTRRRRTSIGDAKASAGSMTEASCRKPWYALREAGTGCSFNPHSLAPNAAIRLSRRCVPVLL